MPFLRNEPYSREEICEEYGIPTDCRAVLQSGNLALAVVVNESGEAFNGRRYTNVLDETSFTMMGRADRRGALIEERGRALDLFFRRKDEAGYRYEGRIEFDTRLDVGGAPMRRFKRL